MDHIYMKIMKNAQTLTKKVDLISTHQYVTFDNAIANVETNKHLNMDETPKDHPRRDKSIALNAIVYPKMKNRCNCLDMHG